MQMPLNHVAVLPITHSYLNVPKLPDYFGDISVIKAILPNYLKEKFWSEINQQLSFKYFSNL